MRTYSVEALDFDPPIIELVHAETASKARAKVAYRAYDAGWYETFFAAVRRMRVVRVPEPQP